MGFNPRQDIGSPSFVYDKIYESYNGTQGLKAQEISDGISIGRYAIILYPREIRDNRIVIVKPEIENQEYWDTAIFQKQYNSDDGEHYEFITYLGVFGDTPPTPNSIVVVDRNRNMVYNTQSEDNWIQLDTENNTVQLTHKLNEDTTGSQTLTPTQTTLIGGGVTLTLPTIVVDTAGHIISNNSVQFDFTNIASLQVGSFGGNNE